MKWNNKGHQFDDVYKKYRDLIMTHQNRIYFWGAGRYGEIYYRQLHPDFQINGFVDNNKEKVGTSFCGLPVISIDEAKLGGFVVITVSNPVIMRDIKCQLDDMGKKEWVDYCEFEYFKNNIYPLLLLYQYNVVYVPVVELSLTERCTLKCKKCAHGCQYVPMNKPDMDLDEAKISVDYLFNYADLIGNFYLIGGETLLYKELGDIIDYVGSKYRDKMINFMISTNGTILPTKTVLSVARKHGAMFNVSNYTVQNPWLTVVRERVIKTLMNNECITNSFEADREWYDYGFDFVDHNGNEEELISIFDNCSTLCREIRGEKFYYCIQARAVSENMDFKVGESEYLDLSELCNNDYGKKIFFEYANGYSEKGYLDMCNYCNGAENYNYIIPAGEQLKND